MDLQQLIDRGEQLKQTKYDSPVVDMWQNDVKAVVAEYGEATSRVLQNAMHFRYVIRSDEHGQQMHQEMIDKVIELLNELKQRNSADTQAQSRIITQKKDEAKASLGVKIGGSTTFNGPVTFGDNSPANSVQVSELMAAIISQAEEALPEGPEKDKILGSLKSVLANPTFAAMAGASLPEILKRLLG
jgi:hypothetical protein